LIIIFAWRAQFSALKLFFLCLVSPLLFAQASASLLAAGDRFYELVESTLKIAGHD
jgi:hypothetical protein